MTDYRSRFKSCGKDVVVEDNVYIEHPELMEVGDRVRFCRGFYMIEGPQICQIGSDVTFWPNCFIQGRGARFIVEDHVDFYPTTYISFGDNGIIEIAHHTHFAPGCALYGHGHLKIGPYCNIAAHCVLATVGHDPNHPRQANDLLPRMQWPDHPRRRYLARRQRNRHRQRKHRQRLHRRRQCGPNKKHRRIRPIRRRPRTPTAAIEKDDKPPMG